MTDDARGAAQLDKRMLEIEGEHVARIEAIGELAANAELYEALARSEARLDQVTRDRDEARQDHRIASGAFGKLSAEVQRIQAELEAAKAEI